MAKVPQHITTKEDLTLNDWSSRWENNDIFWHKPTPHPDLVAYLPLIKSAKRMLIPLCGKSIDLIYLVEQKYEVVGIEYVESAIHDFFNENQAILGTRTREQVAPGISKHTAEKVPLTLFSSDIFDKDLTAELIGGKCDGAFDRGSFVALNRQDRVKYMKKMFELTSAVSHTSNILLNAFAYPQSTRGGPPFSLTYSDIVRTINLALGDSNSDEVEKNANNGRSFASLEEEMKDVQEVQKVTKFSSNKSFVVELKLVEDREDKARDWNERMWIIQMNPFL